MHTVTDKHLFDYLDMYIKGMLSYVEYINILTEFELTRLQAQAERDLEI